MTLRKLKSRCASACAGVLFAACTLRADAPPGPPASQPATNFVHHIELKDITLTEAVRLISRQTDVNIVASQEAGKVKVSLFLQKVSPKTVIDELCRTNNLWYRQDEKSGVYRIMTVSEFQHDLTAFRESRTQIFAVMYPNAVSIATAIQDLYGDRVQLSLGMDEGHDETRDINERFNRFDIINQRSQDIGLFGSGGTTFVGGSDYGSSYRSTGSTYASTGFHRRGQVQGYGPTPSESAEDLRPLTPGQAEAVSQVLRESQGDEEHAENGAQPSVSPRRILEAYAKKHANIYVRVIRQNNQIVVRTSDQAALQDIARLVQRLDVPTPAVLLEVKVLSIQLGDDFTSVFDYQFSDTSQWAGGFTTGDINAPASDLIQGNARKFASLAPGGTGIEQRDLIFQFVSGRFRSRMQMLEDKNRVTELATPLLLTANNEVSRLFVGEERPIVRNISSQAIVNNNNTTISPNTTIEFRPVGTTLLITPNINADRTVTLRILQENSMIIPEGATIPVVTSTGTVVSQPVDVVSARTLSGAVVAKDGLMLAVGGLIEESVTDKRAHVPVLGRIPGLGFFFRRQETGRSRNELVIMIRPHILSTPAESEALSQDLLNTLSIHPTIGEPADTLNTFQPDEALKANPAYTPGQALFRFHSVTPADY